jgi:hypothetical protein
VSYFEDDSVCHLSKNLSGLSLGFQPHPVKARGFSVKPGVVLEIRKSLLG